jgi:hypothetical protein
VGSVINLAYGHDPDGNVISILDGLNPSGGEPLETLGAYSYQHGSSLLIHIDGTPLFDFVHDTT